MLSGSLNLVAATSQQTLPTCIEASSEDFTLSLDHLKFFGVPVDFCYNVDCTASLRC